MGHIAFSAEGATAHADWLSQGAALADETNRLADRRDLVVALGPGIGGPFATACFIPALGEVQVNTETCLPGVKPESVDLGDRLHLLAHPAFYGALAHEAAHAKHSTFLNDLHAAVKRGEATRREMDVVINLEESRIERNLLVAARSSRTKIPGSLTVGDLRIVLRACAADIVLKDFDLPETPYGAAAASGLLLARVDGGTLDRIDVVDVREAIVSVLGEDLVETGLRPLWKRFHTLDDADLDGMLAVAREWLALLSDFTGEDENPAEGGASVSFVIDFGDEDGEGSGSGEGSEGEGSEDGDGEGSGDSDEGEGSGKGSGAGEDESGADGGESKINRAVRGILVDADADATEARAAERGIRRAKARTEDAKRHKEAERAAEAAGFEHGYSDTPNSRRFRVIEPDDKVRRAATVLAQRLSKVSYSDRSVTPVKTAVPPGRLRGKGMIAKAADEARGGMSTATPWQTKRKHHTDTPPLTVGYIQDVSGSMGSAEVPVATSAWTMLEAGHKIGATVSSVLMGYDAWGAVPPGARHKKIHAYSADAGTEAFRAAFLALDGAVNLIDGTGARLLVIGSDGWFVNDRDAEYARYAMGLCKRAGVAVLWLDFTGGIHTTYGYGTVVDVCGKGADEVARLVGDAAIKALAKAKAGA